MENHILAGISLFFGILLVYVDFFVQLRSNCVSVVSFW